ncbi:MAG: SRPBCC family protein [Acidimicrobiia bacterium]|nr:SRPBCC family protein [Acidimicrobiia bacterium]
MIEESIDIAAPPERLYDMVSDLSRMGEWSPENQGGKWVGGATGAAEGARFKGSNRNGWRKWSTVATVVTANPPKEVAWETKAMGMKVALWRYRFEPKGTGGTTVTESTEDRRGAVMKVLGRTASGVADREAQNKQNMRATLEQLKKAAESG